MGTQPSRPPPDRHHSQPLALSSARTSSKSPTCVGNSVVSYDVFSDLDNYLATIAGEFTRTVRQLARSVPVIVGEWSLDTSSPRAEEKPEAEKLIYYRALADAQVRA